MNRRLTTGVLIEPVVATQETAIPRAMDIPAGVFAYGLFGGWTDGIAYRATTEANLSSALLAGTLCPR